jgi:hypothetical protein
VETTAQHPRYNGCPRPSYTSVNDPGLKTDSPRVLALGALQADNPPRDDLAIPSGQKCFSVTLQSTWGAVQQAAPAGDNWVC